MGADDIRGHRWPKGKSANPGGLTSAQHKARRMVSDLVSAETDGGAEIVKFALGVMRGETIDDQDGGRVQKWDEKSRRWAASFLADRLWGKAPATITVTRASEPLPDLSGLSLEELRALEAELQESADEPAAKPPPGSN